jgi:CubicO group peptidase (beta-lactamase class C family)
MPVPKSKRRMIGHRMTLPRRSGALAALVAVSVVASVRAHQSSTGTPVYFPPAGTWASRSPADLGLDKAKLDDAIAFAVAHENPGDKDLAIDTPHVFRNEAPYNALIGPTQVRAGSNGLIVRHGYVAAAWGDTSRADMTYSVTKTFLSTVVGLAFDRGQIHAVTDRVAPYMPAGVDLFAAPHNAVITWEHLLRQTSDWSGTLWGKPDWADRPPSGQTPDQWPNRVMHEPGTFYKYNDTRVNVLALATLYVLKTPLPDVLRAGIMAPIAASDTWHWEGYENSWVGIDGKRMQSMPGGGHFGGGMFINAWDLARFGYLFLNQGRWAGRQLISERWISLARSPGPANAGYGFCNWFLNNPTRSATDSGPLPLPAVPRSAVTFQGNGENIVYLDWDHDLLVVVRWIDNTRDLNEFLGRVLAAVQ